jgi:hypothetical protein
MTKAEIRAIWEKAPGLKVGGGKWDGCWCAANAVGAAARSHPLFPDQDGIIRKAGLNPTRIINENDGFDGTPQERRDHMIALLDAGKLDA